MNCHGGGRSKPKLEVDVNRSVYRQHNQDILRWYADLVVLSLNIFCRKWAVYAPLGALSLRNVIRPRNVQSAAAARL